MKAEERRAVRSLSRGTALCLVLMLPTPDGHGQTLPSVQSFIEPDHGRAPIIGALDQATQSVDLYIFSICGNTACDEQIISSIRAAAGRLPPGAVRVLLEPCPGEGVGCDGASQALRGCERLLEGGLVAVKWASAGYVDLPFEKTHAKSILIDNAKALVTTLNLRPSTFDPPGRRDYGVIVTNDADGVIENLSRVFSEDWGTDETIASCFDPPARISQGSSQAYPALVISPDNGRERMLALIRSAQAPGSLKVQMEKIDRQVDDPDILCALIDRIQSGVQVQVLLNPDEPRNLRVARAITAAGGTAKYQNQTPPRPRLHAKMIIVNDQRVYLGSHNLTRKSLNERREIGWVTDDPGTISSFGTIFDQDWIEGTEELAAQPSCLP